MTQEEEAKLRRDAENILTWDVPTDGDPLTFMHLRRFAQAALTLLAEMPQKHASTCDLAPYLLGLMRTRCSCGVLDHAVGTKIILPGWKYEDLEVADELEALAQRLRTSVDRHATRAVPTGTCPCCGSSKIAPTGGNAVGNTMDCLNCGTDFTPEPEL